MNVLIVDDEILLLDDILDSVNWSKLAIDRVFTAQDIETAKAVIHRENIDILLCDIELQQGNGLDLLEWVKVENAQIIPIVLTCHMEFKYAQRALKLGCLDFILKPINYPELETVILQAVNKNKQDNRLEKFSRYGEFWLKYQPIMIEKLWLDIIRGRIEADQDAIAAAADSYNLPYSREIRVLPILLSVRRWAEKYSLYEQKAISYCVRNIAVETVLNNGERGQIVELSDDRFILLLGGTHIEADNSQTIVNECRACVDGAHKYLLCDINAYLGNICQLSGLSAEVQNIRQFDQRNVAIENDVFSSRQISRTSTMQYDEATKLLSILLDSGQFEAFLKEAQAVLKRPDIIAAMTQEDLKRLHYTLLTSFCTILEDSPLQMSDITLAWQDRSADQTVTADRSLTDLLYWLEFVVAKILNSASSADDHGKTIHQIKQYIDQHVSEDLSRDTIAAHFFINADYMDRLFKKETGLSVTKTIEHQRIDLSKDLLIKTDMSLGQIAEKLGFRHTDSFSSAFKRILRMNPTKYRNRH